MNLEALLQTYERMLSPPPVPKGRPNYTALTKRPPMIQSVAHAAKESEVRSLDRVLTSQELWVSAIYYCQGVIRSNLSEGRIHFIELDAGMDELRSLFGRYNMPALSGLAPSYAFRFADVGADEWA